MTKLLLSENRVRTDDGAAAYEGGGGTTFATLYSEPVQPIELIDETILILFRCILKSLRPASKLWRLTLKLLHPASGSLRPIPRRRKPK
jgi:hypothetical protein